jgi:hypothetical protein
VKTVTKSQTSRCSGLFEGIEPQKGIALAAAKRAVSKLTDYQKIFKAAMYDALQTDETSRSHYDKPGAPDSAGQRRTAPDRFNLVRRVEQAPDNNPYRGLSVVRCSVLVPENKEHWTKPHRRSPVEDSADIDDPREYPPDQPDQWQRLQEAVEVHYFAATDCDALTFAATRRRGTETMSITELWFAAIVTEPRRAARIALSRSDG